MITICRLCLSLVSVSVDSPLLGNFLRFIIIAVVMFVYFTNSQKWLPFLQINKTIFNVKVKKNYLRHFIFSL